jgi:iron complex transport system substrate-binding protein
MESQPTFTGLDVVESGGLISLDPIVSDAVSAPNPLTIPFVLEDFVAKINQAIAASATISGASRGGRLPRRRAS